MTEANEMLEERVPSGEVPPRPYGYYALFIAVYNLLLGGFFLLYRRAKNPLESLTGLDLVMLGLATLRVSKVISEDEVAVVLRKPVIEEVGGQRRPVGNGFRGAVGKLVLCPTCIGTWVAAFLGYGLHLFPRYTRPMLAIMSASGISQFADAILSLVYTDRNVLQKEEPD